jgi:hypothetical protein
MYDIKKLKKGYIGNFVIHHHDATNLHWDLRLSFPVTSLKDSLGEYIQKRNWDKTNEPKTKTIDKSGLVYRSWAIPKHKLPTSGALLARETEDHVFEYGLFEGKIPEGYGAGKVEIYDQGKYTLLDFEYDKKYVFFLNGEKVNGHYALIKTKGKNFIWIKVKDIEDYKDVRIAKIAMYLYN